MSVDEGAWRAELALHGELFGQLAQRLARRPAGHQGQDRGAAGGLIQAAGVCFTSRLRSVRGPVCAGSRTFAFNVRER